jgi:fibronectin type 3 domain-containing protein
MRYPLHSSPALRCVCVFSFAALFFIAGCGKLNAWYAQRNQPENPHSVTISWAPSVSPVAGYHVYRASPPAPPVRVTVNLVSGTQFTDKTVDGGRTYLYYVTSVDFKGMESDASKKVEVTVPATVTPPAKQ